MHDVLRSRLLRHIEALPEAQLYQALDYVEFLAQKYARESIRPPNSVQKFGELLEDKMRGQGLGLGTIRGTLGMIGTADRIFSGLQEAGKTIIQSAEEMMAPPPPRPGGPGPTDRALPPSTPSPPPRRDEPGAGAGPAPGGG